MSRTYARKHEPLKPGQVFARLTVLGFHGVKHVRIPHWNCRCSCGSLVVIGEYNLRYGHTTSCGCVKGVKRRTHGGSRTPEYGAYHHARERCNNPRVENYAEYGGRGIRFMFKSFEDFIAVLGPRPAGHTLDRVDNDGHYTPGNVRWATYSQQNANQRPRRTYATAS